MGCGKDLAKEWQKEDDQRVREKGIKQRDYKSWAQWSERDPLNEIKTDIGF